MSWPQNRDPTFERSDDRREGAIDRARPSGIPSLRQSVGISVIAAGPVAVTTAVATMASSTVAVIAGIAAGVLSVVGGGVGQYLNTRAGAHASESANDAQRRASTVTAAASGALEQAHATIAAVLRTIRETDTAAEQVYDTLETSRQRLAAALGGQSHIPAELQETYHLNHQARNLLEQANQALNAATTELAHFDTTTLQTQ